MRIIVADDFVTMRRIVRECLTNLGYTDIIDARNGKEAWDKIIAVCDVPEKRIEMGIIDWNMPVMTGLLLLKMIREDERTKDFIFIMLTAEQQRENIMAASQYGVDEYILKPFNHDSLKGRLLNLGKKRLGNIEKEIVTIQRNSAKNP